MAGDKRGQDRHSIEFRITAGSSDKEIGYYCSKFEWVSFVNGGNRITASFKDTHQNILDEKMIKELLKHAKTEKGIDVEARIWQHYERKRGKKTAKRKLKVLSLNSNLLGSITEATLELVCIDAASWLLNRGKCDGHAYKGSIGGDDGVIAQIANKYSAPEKLNIKIDKTKDDKNNWWWDMRLDPKTVISSLIEWSASITDQETPMVIQCQDFEFKCKEWSNLPPTKTNGKKFSVAHRKGHIQEWTDRGELQILSNNLLSPAATRLYTGSISATTGLYVDKGNSKESGGVLTPKQTYVNDKLSPNKLGPNIKADQGYSKPVGESATFIEPVPEHNNGDVGVLYQDYSVGRARNWFMKTIYTTMRVKLTIEPGDTDFDDAFACGRDRIFLEVITLDKDFKPYYINGNWMLYGFRHMCDWEHWKTELLLCRIEHDAAKKSI